MEKFMWLKMNQTVGDDSEAKGNEGQRTLQVLRATQAVS